MKYTVIRQNMTRLLSTTEHIPAISRTSKIELAESLAEAKNSLSKLSAFLTIVLFSIGILNFINTMSANILNRKKEFASVEAVPVSVLASEAAEVMLIDCLKICHSCSNACQFHQQMIDNLLQIVAAKNLMFHQKIEVTSKRTTHEKLMAYLMLQAKQFGSLEFEIPYDRQELADYLEVERSGLSAEIGKLRRQGVIEADRNRFKIYKPFDV